MRKQSDNFLPKLTKTGTSNEIIIPSVARWEDSHSLGSSTFDATGFSLSSAKKSKASHRKESAGIQISGRGKVKLRIPVKLADVETTPSKKEIISFPMIPQSNLPAIHRPSGELSVVSEASSPTSVKKRKYTIRETNQSLWGAGEDSLEVVERKVLEEMEVERMSREREQREARARAMKEIEQDTEGEEDETSFLSRLHASSYESESEGSDFIIGLRDSLTRLAASKARDKLKNLAKFISGHTNRKLLSCWNMIESRFKQSSAFKTAMVADGQGLFHPVRQNALPISGLIRIVCSSKVRVGHGEIAVILERIGISEKEIEIGLKIAALQVVVQVCSDADSPMAEVYKEEMQQLLPEETSLIGINDFIEQVFPVDEFERHAQFEEIKGRKKMEVELMLLEKRKKEEMKQKQEMSRKKMIDDFEKVLDQLQVLKKVFNRTCADNFLFVVNYSRTTVLKHNEELSSKVPPDLVFFLGLEHFPKTIIEKITNRMNAHKRESQQKLMSRSTSNRSLQRGESIKLFDSPSFNGDSPSVSRVGSFRENADSPLEKANSFLMDYEDFSDMRVESISLVKLAGHPSVMSSLRALVALGKTFPRYSFRDMVEILQYIAAAKISACFRGHRKQWRYFAARNRWRTIFRGVQRKFYGTWADNVKYIKTLRYHCLRKIVAWKYYTKRSKERREAFRLCFWPLYIWRKYSSASATAKVKAKFLAGRVMPTLISMKVFRAWKQYSIVETRMKRLSTTYYNNLMRDQSYRFVTFWHEWAHQRHWIREAWRKRGKYMRRKNLMLTLSGRFLRWKLFAWFRKMARIRAAKSYFQIWKVLLNGKKNKKKLSYSEKRLLQASRRKQIEGTKISKSKKGKGKSDKVDNFKEIPDSGAGKKSNNQQPKINTIVKFDPTFTWKRDIHPYLDIDSDGDDIEDVPDHLITIVNDHVMHFPETLEQLPFKIENPTPEISSSFQSLQKGFRHRDYWNMLDASMRFHKYASLVVRNLRYNAIVKKNVRRYKLRFRLVLMKRVWNGWVGYAKTGGGPLRDTNSTAAPSEAEVLYYKVRSHMSSKLSRTRKIVAEINKFYDKDAEDEAEDDAERAAKQMRNLNLISDDNDDDFKYAESQRKRAQQRASVIKSKKEKQAKLFRGYEPPNVLELDDKDREKELNLAKNMLKYSQLLTKSLYEISNKADEDHALEVRKRQRLNNMVNEVLSIESEATETAMGRQQAYGQKFKEHAAERLIDVLCKVYKEVQKKIMQDESKVYFRGLRMPMLIARSKKMLNRKKIKNYIRICQRLKHIFQRAPYYHRMRTMWVIYKRWLRYVSYKRLDCSPGLMSVVKRRLELMPDLHHHLMKEGYGAQSYYGDDKFRKSLSDFKILFIRWKTHTQECLMFNQLKSLASKAFRMKLLLKCFWALKTGLKVYEIPEETVAQCFPLLRLKTDFEQVTKRFLPMRKKLLPGLITKITRKVVAKIKSSGKKADTFKSFLKIFIDQISLRISTEQRLLHESFEARGSQEFVDVLAPFKNHPIIPSIMTKLDGKSFFDPHVNPKDPMEPTIPAGFRLSKIKWAIQAAANVGHGGHGSHPIVLLGWQLMWSADGASEIESPARGLWHSAGVSTQESIIPKEDFLIGIEYLHDGPTIVGIRLKLFFGGFTKWIGGKTSLSTLSVYLGADSNNLSPLLGFEQSRRLDQEEINNPAFPYSVVVGLSGLIHGNKTTNIGLVIRKIRQQNLFSYFWVQDVLERKKLSDSLNREGVTANSSLIMNEVHSVPSELHMMGSYELGMESVTMGSNANLAAGPSHSSDKKDDDEEEFDDENEGEEEGDDGLDPNINLPGAKSSERARKRVQTPKIARKFAQWLEQDEMAFEKLSSAEVQFFDVLRMRMTELSSAKTRADEFARRIWTSREIRKDPQVNKLVNLQIVSSLARWLFNAISRRLIPFCHTERRGLYLFKLSRRLEGKAKVLYRRARNSQQQAHALETSRQPWHGKPVLGPQERAAKKQLFIQIAELRAAASKLEEEAAGYMLQARENDSVGLQLLPKISLNLTVFQNFKTKIAAARHKESLLERMSLDNIKSGLFGSKMKESLLNKDQMQAVHASLRDRVIVMKDTNSLQTLVNEVLETERKLLEEEWKEKMKKIKDQKKNNSRLTVAKVKLFTLGGDEQIENAKQVVTMPRIHNHAKSGSSSTPNEKSTKKTLASQSATTLTPTPKQTPAAKKKAIANVNSALTQSTHSSKLRSLSYDDNEEITE